MLGACLAYIGISLMLGIFLAALGYRHRIWSRAPDRSPPAPEGQRPRRQPGDR